MESFFGSAALRVMMPMGIHGKRLKGNLCISADLS